MRLKLNAKRSAEPAQGISANRKDGPGHFPPRRAPTRIFLVSANHRCGVRVLENLGPGGLQLEVADMHSVEEHRAQPKRRERTDVDRMDGRSRTQRRGLGDRRKASLVGALRQERQERLDSRGAGCVGDVDPVEPLQPTKPAVPRECGMPQCVRGKLLQRHASDRNDGARQGIHNVGDMENPIERKGRFARVQISSVESNYPMDCTSPSASRSRTCAPPGSASWRCSSAGGW